MATAAAAAASAPLIPMRIAATAPRLSWPHVTACPNSGRCSATFPRTHSGETGAASAASLASPLVRRRPSAPTSATRCTTTCPAPSKAHTSPGFSWAAGVASTHTIEPVGMAGSIEPLTMAKGV